MRQMMSCWQCHKNILGDMIDQRGYIHNLNTAGLFILEQSTRNSSNTYTPVSEKIRMHASYTLSEM